MLICSKNPFLFPNRKNLESLEKCRSVHRAISAGVETWARSPGNTTASRVEQGGEVPCLERGSGTFLRHWAKRESASGTDGSVDIGTSVCERKKKGTEYHYYVKNGDAFGSLYAIWQNSGRVLKLLVRQATPLKL